MATARQRGQRWEFKVTRKAVLPAPGHVYFTFDTEAEGAAYCARLERLLDKGIVPEELLGDQAALVTLSDAFEQYQKGMEVAESDRRLLRIQAERIGALKLTLIDYNWVERWVRDMKRKRHLAPGTIRHHVGAVSRCMDWLYRKGKLEDNPLRMLPRGYAKYTEADHVEAGVKREDVERDRRLEPGEEQRVRAVLTGTYQPADGKTKETKKTKKTKKRGLVLDDPLAMGLLFEIAIESAMRLREIYTLTRDQVDLSRRTIFLDKTKNGDKRQVPISSTLGDALKTYFEVIDLGALDKLFPFWDGQRSERSLKNTTSKLSTRWGRLFAYADVADYGFHDLRHEATSRLFERTNLTELEIAKVTGHKDLKMLKRYANLRGSTLADRLW